MLSKFINYIIWCCLLVGITVIATSYDMEVTEQDLADLEAAYAVDDYGKGLKDWSFFNYSTDEWHARSSLVKWGGKTYDPLSFKGGKSNTYAISFYLGTEVAVSAAQYHDGRLFDVAQVNGSDSYKAFMSQMQQDLKGDRASYYTEIDYPSSGGPIFDITFEYLTYLKRIYNYLTHEETPVTIPDAKPIFKEILWSLQNATEETLGVKMNTSEGFYEQGQIYIYISAPWEFNRTTGQDLRRAMRDLHMTIHYDNYRLEPQPEVCWHDHTSDERDYSGDNGTAMAFEQARNLVEMIEYDPTYRWGDFTCGTSLVAEAIRVEKAMKENGTWVEPPRRKYVTWKCMSWMECLTAWPWGSDYEYEYWEGKKVDDFRLVR